MYTSCCIYMPCVAIASPLPNGTCAEISDNSRTPFVQNPPPTIKTTFFKHPSEKKTKYFSYNTCFYLVRTKVRCKSSSPEASVDPDKRCRPACWCRTTRTAIFCIWGRLFHRTLYTKNKNKPSKSINLNQTN